MPAELLNEKAKEPTVAQNILVSFIDQNERFFQTMSAIEGVGHRLKNTNSTKEMDMESEKKQSDGFLHEFSDQVDRYRQLNIRLDELFQKLDSLI